MNHPRVVAIDGPAGSGKSTLARHLARALGLPYVNTGLMYRAVTLEAVRRTLDLDDGPALGQVAGGMKFDLSLSGSPRLLLIEDREPPEELTDPEVETAVSRVYRHSQVRAVLRTEQRRLGENGAVMEGRDIGSVVFPDAAVKIFLEAPAGERAKRRIDERGAGAPPEEIARALVVRDERDAAVNPFVPAADAVVIDTSDRTADDVFAHALEIVSDRLAEPS